MRAPVVLAVRPIAAANLKGDKPLDAHVETFSPSSYRPFKLPGLQNRETLGQIGIAVANAEHVPPPLAPYLAWASARRRKPRVVGYRSLQRVVGFHIQERSVGHHSQERVVGHHSQERVVGHHSQERVVGHHSQEQVDYHS
jgi:hypothetical protein